MGKLGGREMTAASDLDLILVYDFDDETAGSDGARPLYGGQYFARLTQRLISALTAQTNYGALYPGRHAAAAVRPFRAGRDAARRLRELSGERGLDLGAHGAHAGARGFRLAGFRARMSRRSFAGCCAAARDRDAIAGDVVEMRAAIAAEKGDDDRWDLKYAAGGLIDIEFIAQYLQLVHAAEQPDILDTSTARVLDKAARLGVLSTEDAEVLRPAVRLYQDLTQILRLCLPAPFDPKTAGAGLLQLAGARGRRAGLHDARSPPRRTQARVRASFVRILGRGSLEQAGLSRVRCRSPRVAGGPERQPHQHDRAGAERRADAHARRHAVRSAIWRSRGRGPSPDASW